MQGFTIEGELVSLNDYIDAERGNRYSAAAIKKAETQRVYYACKEQHVVPMPNGISSIHCDWYTRDLRKDGDNIAFALKFIMDGLVLAKVLPDDTRRYTGSIHHQFYVDAKRPRCEVILR